MQRLVKYQTRCKALKQIKLKRKSMLPHRHQLWYHFWYANYERIASCAGTKFRSRASSLKATPPPAIMPCVLTTRSWPVPPNQSGTSRAVLLTRHNNDKWCVLLEFVFVIHRDRQRPHDNILPHCVINRVHGNAMIMNVMNSLLFGVDYMNV